MASSTAASTAKLEQARALHGLGVEAMAHDRYEAALGYYDQALQLSPTSLGILLNRGNCLRRLGRPVEALASRMWERSQLGLAPESFAVGHACQHHDDSRV